MATPSSKRSLAPAPPDHRQHEPPQMPYTCQTCARRKVKCDKITPTCSACRKSQLGCTYQAPRPRTGKRKPDEEILEKLARYEGILRKHGLLPDSELSSTSASETSNTEQPVSLLWDKPEGAKAGKLLEVRSDDPSQATYVNSSLWQKLEEHHLQSQSDDDENLNDQTPSSPSTHPQFSPDPLTDAFLGRTPPPVPLAHHHPPPSEALFLWNTYTTNVDPLCKILHTPTIHTLISTTTSQSLTTIPPTHEPLLFAIYHFAIFSMTSSDCLLHLGQSRAILLTKYHTLTTRALTNTSYLDTPSLPVLQALTLHLLSSRNNFHPQTYWILTGAALRIAQRLGIHRDGTQMGLPPFEVEMRRRLFYQLMPLDARASQFAGMGAAVWPGDWDTKPPMNVDDADIWPGMGEFPVEKTGATEMVFCLARVCVGGYFLRSGPPHGTSTTQQDDRKMGMGPMIGQFRDATAAEEMADLAEAEVEKKYLRYCDVVNPLHFLTACMVRAGIATLRLRIRLPRATCPDPNPVEVGEAFGLAMKILKSDDTLCSHPGLEKYFWHTGSFFVWGTWDAFIFVLTTLLKQGGLVSKEEVKEAWDEVGAMYRHHEELVGSKRALYQALRRLTVKAWDAGERAEGPGEEEPEFMAVLRGRRASGLMSRVAPGEDEKQGEVVEDGQLTQGSDFGHGLGIRDESSFEPEQRWEGDGVDWDFWSQLIQDHDMAVGQ